MTILNKLKEGVLYTPYRPLNTKIPTIIEAGKLQVDLARAIDDIYRRPTRKSKRGMTVDLHEVKYIDEYGLKALLAAHKACAERNIHFVIQNPQERVLEKFTRIGITETIDVYVRPEQSG